MIELWLIGIGTGSPGHVTLEAQVALRDAALILVPRKGVGKDDLVEIRHRIIAEAGSKARLVAFDYPVRDPALPYLDRVERWHDEIAARWQAAIDAAGADGPVALLVWGDPSLYDSTLRIARRLDPAPRLKVFPGITALQALTAAHAIPLNALAGTVTVTTGRRLRDHGWPEGAESVVVMLDGECSFQTLSRADLLIWWGAFLGMQEQIVDHGPVSEVAARIVDTRAKAREAHGWIMDTYLLRPEDVS
ncbi:precorrin-6A synthase (deacetylating) [Aestuariivita sp.]|jgi:precorrin-6A synthase|uniref:precorrin-6A synthase (deacetylating) n=1 Tax=Aestuariivita sp. TaxID=1872407 RepID=UPI00216F86FA|nr:precorrin-6A synthase (deacetylating) [Aestuariivita sp.]MCE8009628.1 precorrin-6A synthase (deacetylating) [Aestuariivita sp.]